MNIMNIPIDKDLQRLLESIDPEKESCFETTLRKGFGKIYEVYDGDTCSMIHFIEGTSIPLKTKVRLYGIDTPEMKPPKNAPNREMIVRKAKAAKQRLEELCLSKVIRFECMGHEKYGRALLRITLEDDTDVADCMVREGFGNIYIGGSKIV
jgi:endonuclease YncB( thermonuclease family)